MSAPVLPDWANGNSNRVQPKLNGHAGYRDSSRELGQIGELLNFIPPDCGYDDWYRILAAVHHETGGSIEGLTLADSWSARGTKYKGSNDVRQHWQSFSAGGGITGGSLAQIARDHGADLSEIASRNRGAPRPKTAPKKSGDDDDDMPDLAPWPIMDSKAAHGIVGRIAHLATVDSEADPVAVIATTIAYAAAEFGRTQFTRIGDTVHHSRHFNAIVGQSSRARKGTSEKPVRRIFTRAEEIRLASSSTLPFPSGCPLKISYGPLSSGEGLIFEIRDGNDDPDSDDKGVPDKRLLVVEEELGSALRMFQRTGNNLSAIIRRLWDANGAISPMTKTNRITATDPHINIVGHITFAELQDLLSGTEVWNGFANRFQWLAARRQKMVPFPQAMPNDQVEELATELARVIAKAHASNGHELVMSNSAQNHWASVYAELTADHPGILGPSPRGRKAMRGGWR